MNGLFRYSITLAIMSILASENNAVQVTQRRRGSDFQDISVSALNVGPAEDIPDDLQGDSDNPFPGSNP